MNTTHGMRETQLNIRLSEDEAERLAFLCAHHGLNGPNLLRFLLRKEEKEVREQSPAPAPSSPKKTKK